MKIRIATPMYGGQCKTDYVQSLLDLTIKIKAEGIHDIDFHFLYNESLITRARNTLVDSFLQSDCDALLFIDSDQGFSTDDTLKMIESGKDVIGAIVPMKSINWESALNAKLAGKENLDQHTGYFNVLVEKLEDFSLLEPLEVSYVGTGMMFITRKAFEEMAPHCDRYARHREGSGIIDFQDRPFVEYFKTAIDETGVLLSEDYNFCVMWRKLGNKVYAAPWMTVTHSGEYSFRGNFAQMMMLNQDNIK